MAQQSKAFLRVTFGASGFAYAKKANVLNKTKNFFFPPLLPALA
jgi:hypothetical protein